MIKELAQHIHMVLCFIMGENHDIIWSYYLKIKVLFVLSYRISLRYNP